MRLKEYFTCMLGFKTRQYKQSLAQPSSVPSLGRATHRWMFVSNRKVLVKTHVFGKYWPYDWIKKDLDYTGKLCESL